MAYVRSFLLLLVLSVLGGLAYPLTVTGLAQVFFHHRADGSLLKARGRVIGSALIGQSFRGPAYFHARPSACDYNALPSSGSNLGPTNRVLINRVARQAAAVRAENHLPKDAAVPADLVTASASGLDPDISPQAALLQVPRVAAARSLSVRRVRRLVLREIRGRQFGVLGEPTVNVLELNLALDKLTHRRR